MNAAADGITEPSAQTAARRISDLTSPVWVVAVTSVIFGWLADDLRSGVLVGVLSGLIPGIAIAVKQRRGSVASGWHVTDRAERAGVFAVILVCLVLLAVVLALTDVSRMVVALVVSEFAVIIVISLITALGHKPSVHVAVWTGAWLAVSVLQPWFAVTLAFVPVVAWARVRIAHHTVRQTIAGFAVALAVIPVFLVVAGMVP